MSGGFRLGIDINGVIIPKMASFGSGLDVATTPAILSAIESIATLVQNRFSPGSVYLVSKSSGPKRDRTQAWLKHHRFYERTGILPTHVYFCDSRKDKARICHRLQISHFVDDRLEVLSYLSGVPHRYLFCPSPHEVRRFRSVLSSVVQVDSWTTVIAHLMEQPS